MKLFFISVFQTTRDPKIQDIYDLLIKMNHVVQLINSLVNNFR
jgi:hypothetical protein